MAYKAGEGLAPAPKRKARRKVAFGEKPTQFVSKLPKTAAQRAQVQKTVEQAVAKEHPKGLYTAPTGAGQQARVQGERAARKAKARKAKVLAPVVDVLEETTRPLHAVAGASKAAIEGKDVLKAAKRGIQNKDKTTFSDVLKAAGAPKAIRAPVGFALDVAADPTTYVTGGTASVATKAAERAAADVAKRAAKAGMSEAGAKTVAARAAKNAAAEASSQKGVTVKFAGREVPGVRKASASAATQVKRVASKAASKPGGRRVAKVAAGGKNIVREVRPTMRPAGVDEAQFVAARRAARVARSSVNQASARHQAVARGLKKQIGEDNYATVIDAVEKGQVGKLADPKLREAALKLRSEYRHAKRVRRRAGLAEGTIKDYFPHAREDALRAGLGIDETTKQATRIRGGKPGSAMRRKAKAPISELNPKRVKKGKSPFSTDIPLVHVNYMQGTSRVAAHGDLVKSLAEAGRTARKGEPLKPGEAVYHVGFKGGKYDLREAKGVGKQAGKYVVLHRKTVEDALRSSKPARSEHAATVFYDRVTGAWKRAATATPGFHVRNLIGDIQMGYLAQPGHKIPRNVAQAGKAVRRQSELERNAGALRVAKTAKTIKVAGQRKNLDAFLSDARKHGVIRSGYVGRELEDLAAGGTRRLKKVRGRGKGTVKRWLQNREDLMRLATYKHGLDEGMSSAQAAELSLGTHIDYGDLTSFERNVARRAAPFYTFSARALPLHAKKLVTNPGKFANIEKAREESAKAVGMTPDQFNEGLQNYQQRQAPFAGKFGKGVSAISAALPLTLLNEVPTGNPAKYLNELSQFAASMLNPAVKIPLELYSGKSFYFRNEIEPANAPLVAAPVWVKFLPDSAKKQLGVVDDYVDKRTGKKTVGWRGRSDYMLKQLPGVFNIANQLLSSGTNRRGQGTGAKLISGVLGIKVDPHDPVSAKIASLYEESIKLAKQQAALRQRGINADNPNAEYEKIRDRSKELDAEINGLSVKRGDVVPLKRKPGRKRGSGSLFSGPSTGKSLYDSGPKAKSLFG